MKNLKSSLHNYLRNYWKTGYSPSLKELRENMLVKNSEMLKKVLRNLRINKILDCSYDLEGVYRIYPFKQYEQIQSEFFLHTHY